jgi:hypothetical protein
VMIVCGDVANIAAKGGVQAPEGDCNIPCSGDPIHLCVSAVYFDMWHPA